MIVATPPTLEPPHRDASLYAILLGNAFTLFAAMSNGWSATPVVLVYWVQTATLAAIQLVRMARLKEFSTESFKRPKGAPAPEPTEQLKGQMMGFFLLFHGGWHAGYLALIRQNMEPLDSRDLPGVIASGIVFGLAHVYSYWKNAATDYAGRKPDIGWMMFQPLLRVLPMHFVILIGRNAAPVALPVFMLFKSFVDIVLHVIEHHVVMRPARTNKPPADAGSTAA